MSNALDRIRAKFKTPMEGASRSSKSPSAASAGSLDSHFNSTATPSAGSVGASHRQINSCDGQLTPVQESARGKVLAQLAADPAVQRAFCNRFENGVLIVTLAIRGIGTCELLIPAERFDARELKNFAALLECLGEARS